MGDSGCGGSSDFSLSSSPLFFFSPSFHLLSPPSSSPHRICDLYSRSICLRERERREEMIGFLGDWLGVCSDVIRTGGATSSVVMSTKKDSTCSKERWTDKKRAEKTNKESMCKMLFVFTFYTPQPDHLCCSTPLNVAPFGVFNSRQC